MPAGVAQFLEAQNEGGGIPDAQLHAGEEIEGSSFVIEINVGM